MTWYERFQGWISWFINESNKLNRILSVQARVQQDMTVFVAREQLDSWWASLPAEQQNDPQNKEMYEKRRRNLPFSNMSTLDEMKRLGEDIIQHINDTYINIEPTTPENARAVAAAILAADTAKDLSIGLAGLTTEIASFGQVETLTDFYKFVRTKTGYGGAMTMLMKSPIELGVIRPLSYALHKQFRTTYISSGQAMSLLTKGLITESQAIDALAFEGYSETLTNALMSDRWRELRLGELAWAYNDATVDDQWLEQRLGYARYAPEDRAKIAKMLKDKFLNAYRNRVANQFRNEYKEGYITAQDFRLKLASLEIPLSVRDLLIQEADALFLQDYNADLISAWTTAYKNDILNENDLRGNLSTIIKDPARVEAQVNKAKASRKPAKPVTPKEVQQGIRASSKPSWSSIILDGQDTGKLTPETVTTSTGRHTLVISAEGYADAEFEIDIGDGVFVEVYAPLDKITEGA